MHRSNHHNSQKKASNQKSNDQSGGSRNSDRSHSDKSCSDRGGKDCEPRRPVNASKEASLIRAAQSSGSDTLDGRSPMPLRPPFSLSNHNNMKQ